MSTEQIIKTQYFGYSNIDSKDICIAMCFFNPLNYKNIVNNINKVVEEYKKTNIPVYIIELNYPWQNNLLPYSNIVVKAETVFFVKENLWNILEKHIPDRYSKIIFCDADVLCTDPNWVDKTSQLLNSNKIVHASDIIYKDIFLNNIYESILLDAVKSRCSVVRCMKNNILDPTIFHPGFNISINRDFYHKIGGFFDISPGTAGDILFWSSLITERKFYLGGIFCAPNHKNIKIQYTDYKHKMLKYCDPKTDIDYLPNNHCLHLYHGSTENRNYASQHRFIKGPYQLYKNKYGVIEINISHPYDKDMRSYFEQRREDENIPIDTDA